MLQRGATATVLDAWRARAATMLGRPVEWERDGTPLAGVAEDIDDAGALLVADGRRPACVSCRGKCGGDSDAGSMPSARTDAIGVSAGSVEAYLCRKNDGI